MNENERILNELSRRKFGKIALGSVPAALLLSKTGQLFAAAKPNSKINGVQVGTITYSYGSMPDQGAEATLQYVVDSGISAIELMGGPVNDWRERRASGTRARRQPPRQTQQPDGVGAAAAA